MSFVIISVAIQLAFAIHAIKTNRKPIWVIIIGFVPILGVLAYILVELMPGWLGKQNAGQAQKKHFGDSHPNDLKEALANVELVATVSNRTKLAEQYLLREQFQQAKEQYEKCLVGLHKTDPGIMLGLAKAEFGLANYGQVTALLEALKSANPDYKSSDGHLIYARAQESQGNINNAMTEYEALIQYYPTPEPTCRFALLLKAHGNPSRAKELFMRVVSYSENAGRQYNFQNEEWVTLAKREVRA